MRGFPPLHLLLFILAFGLFSIPLVNLTLGQNKKNSPVVTEEVPPGEVEKIAGYLRIKLAHAPTSLKLELQGETLLTLEDLEGELSAEKEIQIPSATKEFEGVLAITWPDEAPETAVSLEWEPEAHDSVKVTVWGEGSLEEVVNLAWK